MVECDCLKVVFWPTLYHFVDREGSRLKAHSPLRTVQPRRSARTGPSTSVTNIIECSDEQPGLTNLLGDIHVCERAGVGVSKYVVSATSTKVGL